MRSIVYWVCFIVLAAGCRSAELKLPVPSNQPPPPLQDLYAQCMPGQRVLVQVEAPMPDSVARPVWVNAPSIWKEQNAERIRGKLVFAGVSETQGDQSAKQQGLRSSAQHAALQISQYLKQEVSSETRIASAGSNEAGAMITGIFSNSLDRFLTNETFSGAEPMEVYLEYWMMRTEAGPRWTLMAHGLYSFPLDGVKDQVHQAIQASVSEAEKGAAISRQRLTEAARDLLNRCDGALDRAATGK